MLPVSGPRMAIVVGTDVFITSYKDHRVIRMDWPACAGVNGHVHVYRPRGIVYHQGRLFVASYGSIVGSIVCLNASTLAVLYSFKTYRPRGIDVWKNLLVVTQVNRGRIVLFDTKGTWRQSFGGLKEPRDVCVHGDVAYVASTGSDSVVGVNLITNARTTVNSFRRPNGVATNGMSIVTSLWNVGQVIVECNHGGPVRRYAATTPSMASISNGNYLVCDDRDNCMYVISADRCTRPLDRRTRNTPGLMR